MSRIDAARNEAADLLCTADKMAKIAAEQVYWKERGRTEIDALQKAAELELETTTLQGEQNIQAAAREIVGYVTME